MDFYEQKKARGRHRDKNYNSKYPKKQKQKQKNHEQNQNAEIYLETQEYFKKFSLSKTKFPECFRAPIEDDFELLEAESSAKVRVVNGDTLDTAFEYCFGSLENSILVLNMASMYKPGGGVLRGRTAQEENIFRRTNAFMTHPSTWYPLADNEIIYSPEIRVVRDSSYKFLKDKEYDISMIAVPSIKNPQVYVNSEACECFRNASDKELVAQKIESIFKIAILKEKKVLILGALGCGAYNGPVHEIAKIFRKYVKKYRKYFIAIDFAVLNQGRNGQRNFEVFQETILQEEE